MGRPTNEAQASTNRSAWTAAFRGPCVGREALSKHRAFATGPPRRRAMTIPE
jgi:hypothetical protein